MLNSIEWEVIKDGKLIPYLKSNIQIDKKLKIKEYILNIKRNEEEVLIFTDEESLIKLRLIIPDFINFNVKNYYNKSIKVLFNSIDELRIIFSTDVNELSEESIKEKIKYFISLVVFLRDDFFQQFKEFIESSKKWASIIETERQVSTQKTGIPQWRYIGSESINFQKLKILLDIKKGSFFNWEILPLDLLRLLFKNIGKVIEKTKDLSYFSRVKDNDNFKKNFKNTFKPPFTSFLYDREFYIKNEKEVVNFSVKELMKNMEFKNDEIKNKIEKTLTLIIETKSIKIKEEEKFWKELVEKIEKVL